MIKTTLPQILKWGALAVYTFFAYHLLMIPILLEFSITGMIIIWGMLVTLFFVIPRQYRKQVTLFILFTIFTTQAFQNIGLVVNLGRAFQFFVVIAVVFLVARYFGKLSKTAILTLITVTAIINFTVPDDELRLYNHFTKVWESPTLYTGNTVDYFPLFVHDIDDDGQSEIITFGHREELTEIYQKRVEGGLDPDRMPYDLEDEPLFPYIYKWNGTEMEMERVDLNDVDVEELRPYIPKDYIGFPYYVWDENFTLMPNIKKQDLSERMGQFGAMPFHLMNLNLDSLNQYLDTIDGVYDKQNTFRFETDIDILTIEQDELIIERDGDIQSMPTRATKIIDLIRTEKGLGVLLLSDQLELWTFDDDNDLTLTHVLTEEQISDVMTSEYIVADIQYDGLDDILISSSRSRIVKPIADGEWDILFTSRDASLRFEDFDTLGTEEDPSIIALSKSRVRNDPLRFLTGFTYTEDGLQQDWKSFTSLINVESVDITGNGQNELVATIYRTHQIFIFSKHGLPVNGVLVSIFTILVLYTVYRRVRSND